MPSLTAMNQSSGSTVKFKRMKQLFLIFLKQFEMDEYKLLIQFLQLIIDKYNLNPSKLFGFLTSQNEQEEISLNDVMNQKLNAPNRNLTNILNKLTQNTTTTTSITQSNPPTSQPPQQSLKINIKVNSANSNNTTTTTTTPSVTQSKTIIPNNVNDSPFRRSLRINSARLAQSLNKTKSTNERSQTNSSQVQIKQENEVQTDVNVMESIIDQFAFKENQQNEPNENSMEDPDQWDTFNETSAQQYSEDSISGANESNVVSTSLNQSQRNANVYSTAAAAVASTNRIRKFSDRVRNELERSFQANNFITGSEKKVLAKSLNLTERQVSKWFVHRREKMRRSGKSVSNLNMNETYRSQPQQQQQQATNYTYNEEYNDPNELNNDEYYNDNNNNGDEEENWFNDLQAENTTNQQENNYDLNNHESDYNQENDYNYADYNEFQSSDESDEQQYSTETNVNNKRYSMDTNSTSNKRQCLSQTISYDFEDYSNKPQRRLFPPHVISHLESIFDNEKYLKDDQVAQISRETNLSEKQIRSWFKQRRYRYNQENKQNGIDIEIKKYNNLSQNIVDELEKAFLKNNYVYGNDKKLLARKLNMTPVQLERWFYYRRKKQSNVNCTMDYSNLNNTTF